MALNHVSPMFQVFMKRRTAIHCRQNNCVGAVQWHRTMVPEFVHDLLFSRRSMETSEFTPGTDAQVIQDTFRVYGSAFGLMLFAFCVVRKLKPRLFNVRRWAPKIQCELAQHNYGFLSWIWRVYGPTDEEILNQCGMDAVCFLRVIRFGLKVSCVGIVNSFWLLPMYATAALSNETANVQDPVEEMTTSHLPSMSPRFVGTVVAAYIVFLYTMNLLLQEFAWYTKHRHAFLSKRTPRNYTIYVTGIPREYRSSELLLEYFRSCFPPRSVLEAHVAIDLPNLSKLISNREAVIANLEHALAVKQIHGYSPTHLTLQGKVGSISTYRKELRLLNASISSAIRRIQEKAEERHRQLQLGQEACISRLEGYTVESLESEEMDLLSQRPHPQSVDGDSTQFRPVNDVSPNDMPENLIFDPYATLRTKKRNFRDRLSIFAMPEDLANRESDPYSDEEMGAEEQFPSMTPTSIQINQEVHTDSQIETSVDDDQSIHRPELFSSHFDNETSPQGEERNSPTDGKFAIETYNQTPSISHSELQDSLDAALSCRSERYIQFLGSSGKIVKVLVSSGKIVKVLTGSSTDTIAREVGNAIKEVNVDNLKSVTDKGMRTLKKSGVKGIKRVTSVGTVALSEVVHTAKDLIIGNEDGNPRDAGFVVFTKLSTTHAALQMIHHSKPYTMNVKEAPEPHDIFWDNVGKSEKSRQVGQLISFALSAILCFFWTIPVSVISGFSEIDSLKASVPFLATLVEMYPWVANALSQIAPLLLIGLNSLLPSILREFAKAEGHIASSAVEASVFIKLSVFMIIQTFFVSAISGGVYAQLTEILKDPAAIVDLLGNSLPTRGTYFVQIVLVTTFLGQGLELLRVFPLVIAFLRSKIGPNLTTKERNKIYRKYLRPLSDPSEFEHAQVFAIVVLYFMVIFVYAVISPIINYFMALCFLLMGTGYRYQFISNYPPTPDSGGKLWYGFVTICLSCMVIAQITLVGLLALKKATYALPCMAPLMAITVYFTYYLRGKHSHVTNHLPTRDCLHLDRKHFANGIDDFDFVRNKYLQPVLLAKDEEPEDAIAESSQTRQPCC